MKFSVLIILFIITTMSFSLHARKPAVEDFVGVETENYKKTPEGAEVLFNFGNHISKSKVQPIATTDNGWVSLVGLVMFITLPFLMWFSINKSVQQPKHTPVAQTPPSSNHVDNVESLDKYREDETAVEESKKAS